MRRRKARTGAQPPHDSQAGDRVVDDTALRVLDKVALDDFQQPLPKGEAEPALITADSDSDEWDSPGPSTSADCWTGGRHRPAQEHKGALLQPPAAASELSGNPLMAAAGPRLGRRAHISRFVSAGADTCQYDGRDHVVRPQENVLRSARHAIHALLGEGQAAVEEVKGLLQSCDKDFRVRLESTNSGGHDRHHSPTNLTAGASPRTQQVAPACRCL